MSEKSEKYFGAVPAAEKKGKPGQSYPHRLLQALARIFDDPNASISEKLQALELSAKILPMRPIPKRRTEKDKLIIAALKRKEPKKKEEPEGSSNS